MPKTTACAGCGKVMQRSSAPSPRCRECRAAVHGASRYKRGCRCDECREANTQRVREYVARRAAEGRPVIYRRRNMSRRTCQGCGVEYSARPDSRGLYCTVECCREATRRPPRPSARRRAAERRLDKAARGTSGGKRVWIQGFCRICGTELAPGPSFTCSRKCREQARRRGSQKRLARRRLAIFERDHWTCQICGEATSATYSYSDPWSPTVDHIIPRSRGGSDEPENLRTAHMWCNSVRGNLTHYTDKDLRAEAT